jgi:hypothetical protein
MRDLLLLRPVDEEEDKPVAEVCGTGGGGFSNLSLPTLST